MGKKVVKINESQLRKIIAESIEDVLGDRIDIGQELQHFLEDNKHKLFNKGWGNSQPSKRDYLIAKYFYELGLKNRVLNEEGGYDMSTPEGRQGAEKWMRYIMSQEDPAENAAREWAQENGLDGDENIIRAFIAGVEYGRNC